MKLKSSITTFTVAHFAASAFADEFQTHCTSIVPTLNLINTTVWFSQYVAAGTNLSLTDTNVTCGTSSQVVASDMCRIAMDVATSERSGISMEAWLPRNWTGRFLSTGNGGLAGCIQYADMAYTAGLGFATVGANNGHNGTSGGAFYNNEEVIADFAYRSVHTGVVIGKNVTKAFYAKPHTKSYYLGCSTGGRQGMKSVQAFPEDFDGVVAGAPAIAWNGLISWSGNFYRLTGNTSDPKFVPTSMWPVIHENILKQCDGIDGYVDGIIEDPMLCDYRPESLICGSGSNSTSCLTSTQAETVRNIFSPLYGLNGTLLYPRMQPGSEIVASYIIYNGVPFTYTADWIRYAVYNNPSWNPGTISLDDMAAVFTANPFNIQTFEGDISAFSNAGGKLLHYHGQMDALISSDNSPRYYNHVSRTMGLTSSELDDFYRFFRISGMGHCSGGDGAWEIGQSGGVASLNPDANILMAMVKWVEEGVGPTGILGTKYVNDTESEGVAFKRRHCKYPLRNVYKGTGDATEPDSWECIV